MHVTSLDDLPMTISTMHWNSELSEQMEYFFSMDAESDVSQWVKIVFS